MKMPEVDILLAAYNGEKFIAEQIDSILAQTFQDFRLIIRDDGSSDNTPAIISEYAAKYPGRIEIIHDGAVCKNPTKNFFQLLTYARADYVMFCDQDDVWLPEKIQVTYDRMKETERNNPEKPVLVFTGMQAVDEQLRSITNHSSANIIPEHKMQFRELLFLNCVSGCTEMINRVLWSNMGCYSEVMDYHDWWTALYASSCGVISYVPEHLIMYRIHGKNYVGSASNEGATKKRFEKIVKRPFEILKFSRKEFYRRGNMYRLLHERFSQYMKSECLECLNDCIDLFGPHRIKRLRALFRTHYLSRNNLSEDILFLFKVIAY